MKKALIVGATGFGGLGLIELLLRHPEIKIQQLVARKDTNKPISEIFPHLRGYCDLIVEENEKIDYDNTDIAFFSTPDRAGMTLIHEFCKRNIPVIDFSGDFRFSNTEEYRIYAENKGMETSHLASDLLTQGVYGLPEVYADKIKNAKIVGNPGCFAICMILGLLPAIEAGIIESKTIICDGKSGVSGAGKNPGEANFYPQRYENINTYREGHHQHNVEVENIINKRGNCDKNIFFIPHVIPMTRGILNNLYADLAKPCSSEELLKIYEDYYRNQPFVQITSKSPGTAMVKGSNRCLIRPMVDKRTQKVLITSVIDNLMKGQAGNAIQNANLMLGFDQTLGLLTPGMYP